MVNVNMSGHIHVHQHKLMIFLLVLTPPRLPESEAAVVLRGEGASFPYSVYEQWSVSYRTFRLKYKDVRVTYKVSGSGSGKEAISSRKDRIEYVGSDTKLSESEQAATPDLVIFPTLVSGIVMAYNVPTCSNSNGQRLNLSREHVVGIYNGTYSVWSEPSIQAINLNCTLPNASILVIARQVTSGTTNIFTTALSAFDEHWKADKGSFSEGNLESTEVPMKWDPNVIDFFGPSNQDVAGLIRSIRHSVGYLSFGDAKSAGVDYAALGNRNGRFITPNIDSFQEAMNSKVHMTLTPELVDPELPNAYPITSYSYFIIYKTEMRDCHVATELLRYIIWILETTTAGNDADAKGFATLSTKMAKKVRQSVLDQVTCMGHNVMTMVREAIHEENKEEQVWLIPVAVSAPLFLVIVSTLLAYILFQRIKLTKMINMDDWNIPIEDIIFYYDEKMKVDSFSKSHYLRQKSVRSLKSLGEISNGSELLTQILQWPGKYRANTIGIRLLDILDLRVVSREVKKTMLWMRDSLINTNIVRFYGLSELDGNKYVIGDFCAKGTVLDLVQNDKYNLTSDFKLSIALEIASGMAFLHVNGIVHGMLTSCCCMLDNKWTVKIADWEYTKLLSVVNCKRNPLLVVREKRQTGNTYEDIFREFWTAPEILLSEYEECPTQASDVYSYAIILQELFTREDPYFELADHMTPEQILHAIVHNQLRPEGNSDAPITIRQIMELAWSEVPSARPTFEQIMKMLRRGRTGRKTIMDNMMEAMEDYTAHLEEELEAKESSLQTVTTNLDRLMTELFPPPLLSAMMAGQKLESHIFSPVGIIMLEIMDWNAVMQDSTSTDAVKFWEDLTSQINQIVEKYRAFSPYSQIYCGTQTWLLDLQKEALVLGDRCQAIAHMALDLLKVVTSIKPPSAKYAALPVRLSAHVGPVGTGTLGVTSSKFVFLGQGLNLCRALLASTELNTIKISRNIYSQLERNLDFLISVKDPVWITCNGTDIEAFVITGRNLETIPIPSDTSVDSGVDVERSKPPYPSISGASKSSSSENMNNTNRESTANFSQPEQNREKTTFNVTFGTCSSVKCETRTKQRRPHVTYLYPMHSKGQEMHTQTSSSDFPSGELTSIPLTRISENSDISEVTPADIIDDKRHGPSVISDQNISDVTPFKNSEVTFIDIPPDISDGRAPLPSPPYIMRQEIPKHILKQLSRNSSDQSVSLIHEVTSKSEIKDSYSQLFHTAQEKVITFSQHLDEGGSEDVNIRSAEPSTELDNRTHSAASNNIANLRNPCIAREARQIHKTGAPSISSKMNAEHWAANGSCDLSAKTEGDLLVNAKDKFGRHDSTFKSSRGNKIHPT